MTIRIGAIALLLAVLTAIAAAQERTSENDENLKRALKRHPRADANGDGILTRDEARAYTQKLKAWRKKLEQDQALKPKPTFANVSYGPHERNVLDLWQAQGDGPRPLVIFIHGGGWRGGDKSKLRRQDLETLLADGISVTAVNYRLTQTAPFPAPMRDAARALQFLRNKAGEWNLNPERVACFGGSAGGVTSLWIGFHEDLADPGSPDPVLRQSTRLTCIGANSAPTSFDMRVMKEWVGGEPSAHPAVNPFYGVQSTEELNRPEIQRLMEEASPITHLTKDDPPVFMQYGQPNVPLGKDWTPGQLVHHPMFGVKLKEAMDALGIEAVLRYPNRQEDAYKDMMDFFRQKLTDAH